jgi:hypothetical protein
MCVCIVARKNTLVIGSFEVEIVVLKFSPKKKYGTPRHCFIFVAFLNKLSKTKFALICGG